MSETKKLVEGNDTLFMKIEVDIPIEFQPFLEYIEIYFNCPPKDYLEVIIKREIQSRNSELGLF